MGRLYEDVATIKCDVKWIKENHKEHIADHRKLRLMVYTALIGVVTSLLLILL